MDEAKWAELLELSKKASLFPKTDYRFQSLEIYLSALYAWNQYSQKDKEKFSEEFAALSDEDRAAITSRVIFKTHANSFHLSDEDVEKLEKARKELSFDERARLLSGLFLTRAGTAWLDIGEVFEGKIEIDDSSSPERWDQPYAYIYFSDYAYRRVETVDIIKSIKNNPASIGHPAIIFAIYYWQRVIYTKRVIEREDITYRGEFGWALKSMFGGKEVEVAQNNLKAISPALLNAAKKRAIPKESALKLRMEALGMFETERTVLSNAWERLESKHIRDMGTDEQILKTLEQELLDFENQPHVHSRSARVSASRVMEFLKYEEHESDASKGGRCFVGFDKNGNSLRPSWKVFRNAFAGWFFDLQQGVVQDYLEKAAKQDIFKNEIYQPTFLFPKSIVTSVLYYLLGTPLVMAREPVIVHESYVGFHGLEKAIEDAISRQEGK